jgi:carboxymethylenebutenolidase
MIRLLVLRLLFSVMTAVAAGGCGQPNHEAHLRPAGREQKADREALDDPAVEHEMVAFRSGTDTIHGYLARPAAAGRYPAVVVLHGEFGVSEGQRNIAAQLAQDGFVALAMKRFDRWPTLTPEALAQSDQSDKRFLSGSFSRQEVEDAQAAVEYLKAQSFVTPGAIGALGFCGGGYHALLLSTRSGDIRAVVAFYTPPEPAGQFQNPDDPRLNLFDVVARIRVPVQGHFGADDPFVPLESVGRFERALEAQGTPVTFFTYPGATHVFYDATRRYYHPAAAAQARSRMVEFFHRNLTTNR